MFSFFSRVAALPFHSHWPARITLLIFHWLLSQYTMFARTAHRSVVRTAKRYGSSSSHGNHDVPPRTFEFNITKVFAVAAVLGGAYIFKNDRFAKPAVETKLYKEQADGTRDHLRNENFAQRYDVSFIKEFIRDKGGVGQRQYRRVADGAATPTTLINASSAYRTEFGAGIKTDELAPRQQRIRIFADN